MWKACTPHMQRWMQCINARLLAASASPVTWFISVTHTHPCAALTHDSVVPLQWHRADQSPRAVLEHPLPPQQLHPHGTQVRHPHPVTKRVHGVTLVHGARRQGCGGGFYQHVVCQRAAAAALEVPLIRQGTQRGKALGGKRGGRCWAWGDVWGHGVKQLEGSMYGCGACAEGQVTHRVPLSDTRGEVGQM